MKTIIKLIVIVIAGLFILYTLFVVAVEWVSSDKRASRLSDSIQESKVNNSFVAEYEIESIPDSTRKQLSDVGLLEIIDTLDIWVEKEYVYQSEYLYFNKIVFYDDNNLVFRNPREVLEAIDSTISMKIISGTYPDFGIYQDRFNLSNHNYFQRIVSLYLQDTIPKTVNFVVYLKNMKSDSKDKICGNIKLKLKYINPNQIHIDKRPLWKRITYAL